jgi:CxxC motif-containing protein
MRKKELICVVCPNGCRLEATFEKGREIQLKAIDGELCKKGLKWAEQELINPMRTITSSILVGGGELPLVSVRTDSPIPLADIFEVMKVIKSARVEAPVKIGETLIKNPAGIRCNIIATRNVNEIDPSIP